MFTNDAGVNRLVILINSFWIILINRTPLAQLWSWKRRIHFRIFLFQNGDILRHTKTENQTKKRKINLEGNEIIDSQKRKNSQNFNC